MALMFLSRRKNKKMNVNLNHVSPTTLAPGNIVPISFVRVFNGDDLRFQPSAFVQAMPMNAPLVNGFKLCLEYFFIPDRLYNWDMLVDNTGVTEQPDNVKFPIITAPDSWKTGTFYIDFNNTSGWNDPSKPSNIADNIVAPGSLADYCGFPVGMLPTYQGERAKFNILKMAGYLDVYYHYYVNQQIADFPTASFRTREVSTSTGKVYEENVTYQVSALRLLLDTLKRSTDPENALAEYWDKPGSADIGGWSWFCSRASIFQRCLPPYYLESWLATSGYEDADVKIDLESDGNSISFRNISAASHVRRWLELSLAGGSRYSDFENAQFDTSRMKNHTTPLYLGSDRQYLGSNVIYQTTGAGNSDSPLGAFAGQSSGGERFRTRTYHFGETGYFMVMASLVPDVIYSRGLDPFLRELNLGDVYAPALDNIAMQPLMVEQLDALSPLTSVNPESEEAYEPGEFHFVLSPDSERQNTALGYVPAWSHLLQKVSRVHGRLATDLRYWLLGRRYGNTVDEISNPNIVGTNIPTDFANSLQAAYEAGDISAEQMESLSAFFYRLEASQNYTPYVLPNRYNDVFADASNQAQNFVLTTSFNMRCNREKGKVNVPNTL